MPGAARGDLVLRAGPEEREALLSIGQPFFAREPEKLTALLD